jgi:hypothetical protein
MTGTNAAPPTVLAAELALPVTAIKHEACPVTDVLRRVGDKWSAARAGHPA